MLLKKYLDVLFPICEESKEYRCRYYFYDKDFDEMQIKVEKNISIIILEITWTLNVLLEPVKNVNMVYIVNTFVPFVNYKYKKEECSDFYDFYINRC